MHREIIFFAFSSFLLLLFNEAQRPFKGQGNRSVSRPAERPDPALELCSFERMGFLGYVYTY